MLRKINELRTQKGSMMIEALAMLGLISMVTPVIYKKAAERTTEMQDINAASQVRTVVKAIDDYLRDNYGTITGGGEVTSSTSTVDYSDFAGSGADTKSKIVNIDHFKDYLPLGFQAEGKLFKGFDVAIKQVSDDGGRKALTTVLIAKTSTDGKVDPSFTKIRSSRIASMIGTNGGYIDGDKATGVQGVWEIPKSELPSSADTGTIVATSIEAVADGTAGGSDVLHRVHVDGHPEYNVMETTLSMNNNTIDGLHELISHGNTIKMRQQTESNALTLDVSGSGLFEDTLEIGDALSKGNRFYADRDVLAHSKALYIGKAIDGHKKANAAFYVDGSDGSFHAAKSQDETDPKFEVDGSGNTRADGTFYAVKHKDGDKYAGDGKYSSHVIASDNEFAQINPSSKLYLTIGEGWYSAWNSEGNDSKTQAGSGIAATTTGGRGYLYEFGTRIENLTPTFRVNNYQKGVKTAGTATFYNGLATFQGLGLDLEDDKYTAADIPDTNKVTFNANAFIDGGFRAYKRGTNKYNLTVGSEEATVESIFRAGATESTDTNTKKAYNLNIENDDATLESRMSFDRFSTGSGTAYGTTVGNIGSISTTDGTFDFGHGLKTGYNTSKKQYQAIFGQDVALIGTNNNASLRVSNKNADTGIRMNVSNKNAMAITPDAAMIINQPNENDFAGLGLMDSKVQITGESGNIMEVDTRKSPENDGTSPVYIRQGVIEIAPDYTTTDASGNSQYAHFEGIIQSYNKTDTNPTIDYTGQNSITESQFYNETAEYNTKLKEYDRFFVNPAYTSMMNDIKLATRGGARLSDILPDFINKGIYVMDNTYTGGTDWTTATIKKDEDDDDFSIDGITECSKDTAKCDTTAWMGFIPTPNCPPGYMKVATITPIRFNMAQAGTTAIPPSPTADLSGENTNTKKENYRELFVHRDPRGDDNLILVDAEGTEAQKRSSNTFVALPADDLTSGPTLADQQTRIRTQGDPTVLTVKQATIINQPYNYQINTWLNTTLKGHYQNGNTNMNHLDDENPNKPTYFKGWHGIMGFIYPADDYRAYYNAARIGKICTDSELNTPCSCENNPDKNCKCANSCNKYSSEILWNLFPVYKQELSAIATVYCYFDRTNANASFNNAYVDDYLPHEVTIGNIRNENKSNASNKENLNDPLLPYNSLW